jgi:hypothetical protein
MNEMRRFALTLFAAVLVTRLVTITIAMHYSERPGRELWLMRDGRTFHLYANAIAGGRGGFNARPEYERRAFPGYPLFLVATLAYRAPLIGIVFNILAAALTAWLAYRLYGDPRVGWAMAVLTPSYVLYSSTLMSEAVVLLTGIGALLCARRERHAAAGALLGFAAIARPLSLPFGLAYLAARPRAKGVLVAAMVIAATILWLWWWSGSPLPGMNVYAHDPRAYGNDHIFNWPFASLVRVPLQTHVAAWKVAYVWAHVAIVFGGIALLFCERKDNAMSLTWLASNTALAVCIGGSWGVHEFHRFIIPALPPLFYAYRNVLPRRTLAWIAIAIVSTLLAAKGLSHGR